MNHTNSGEDSKSAALSMQQKWPRAGLSSLLFRLNINVDQPFVNESSRQQALSVFHVQQARVAYNT